MPSARCLCICGKKLTDSDIQLIINRLMEDETINQLDLSNNWIGSQGIKELLKSPYMNKIFYFNLFNNRIGDEGAVALVQSSRHNNIASLDLSMNRLTYQGIRRLSQYIPGSKLVSLSLILNSGADDPRAFQAIIEATRQHPPLQYLQFPSKFEKLSVLRENRRIVSLTIESLSSLIMELKECDRFHYPMDMLDWFVLHKFQEYYSNKMLYRPLITKSDSLATCEKLNNYINENYFKITGVVKDGIRLQDKTQQNVTIADLPPEILSYITRYCYISDVISNDPLRL